MLKNCLVCKKEFYIKPDGLKRGRGKFCSRKCMGIYYSKTHIGEKHQNYKGGTFLASGYKLISIYGDGTQSLEHRIIMEKHLGRKLLTNELVHHINDDKSDNRIENLKIITRSEHMKLHWEKITKSLLNNITFKCDNCGKELTRSMSDYKNRKNHYCSNHCQQIYQSVNHLIH